MACGPIDAGGKGDADGAADWIDGRPRSGSQAGTTAILFDVDFAEIGEVVDDALPFEPAAAGGKAIEELLAQDEGEERAEDVTADAGIGLVKDRAGRQQRLCGFEGVFHGQQIAVAQDDLERSDFGVRAQHEEAVEAGRLAAWMFDSAVCAGMTLGAPCVTVSALAELHQLLTERGFRQSSLGDPTIVQEAGSNETLL